MRPLDDQILDEWLGPQVDVRGVYDCKTLHDSGGFAFELYKEAARLVCFVAHLVDEISVVRGGFDRNQAICAGLMVKISKFMVAVIQLSTNDARGEVVQALNRIIIECAINLEFLVRSESDKYFDQFVERGLGPEAEVYDQIQENIKARNGHIWPIEQRLLSSINHICAASGRRVEEIERKHQNWAENIRERLKVLGKEGLYATVYRMPSHAIHGNWPDLFTAHLKYDENNKVFQPETKWTRIGSRMLSPIAMLVLAAVDPYLGRYFASMAETNVVHERLVDLVQRLREVEAVDEALKVELRKRRERSEDVDDNS